MKSSIDEPTATPPSLSGVHKKLLELQDEFVSLMKHRAAQNAGECDRLAACVRDRLHQAKVFLLSANVEHALQEVQMISGVLQQLQTLVTKQMK